MQIKNQATNFFISELPGTLRFVVFAVAMFEKKQVKQRQKR